MARSTKKTAVPFRDQTVLFHWMLAQLGVKTWDKLPQDDLKDVEGKKWNGSPTPFAEVLRHRFFNVGLSEEALYRLDARVVEATGAINTQRPATERIAWKYFQYLGLLFTELYLERYFGDREALRESLNTFLAEFCERQGMALPLYGYDEDSGADELSRLAFWQATGSGKTLLLHANYYQYHAALERQGLAVPDKVLLVTPNVLLGEQHVKDMAPSGLRGAMFKKSAQGTMALERPDIQVIEITKFRSEKGPDTIQPSYFQGNNLVFVDEGHRGSSNVDGEWRRYRRELSAEGFCFEYSATLEQAAQKDEAICHEYARSVVIDYAYRRFFHDRYGKHWRILNQRIGDKERTDERVLAHTRAYLTGALTVLHQQLSTFDGQKALATSYNLARPFCIFVGASVGGGKEAKAEQTDIVRIIEFLASFASPHERAGNEALLQQLLDGELGIQTKDGADLFHPPTVFGELKTRDLTGQKLYADILKHVFNADGPGLLRLRELKEARGEMSLAIGHSAPFGVLNVGDVAAVRKLCEAPRYARLIHVESPWLRGSLFKAIDSDDSLTILIGSRKFTEGWSSYRVSVMGLLNMGRTPGTQIIQLFGRGVRLLGKGRSLQRSSSPLAKAGTKQGRLRVLETLSVFGIRADYLDRFQKDLRDHGIEPEGGIEPLVTSLPVLRMDPLPELRVIQPSGTEYAASAERPVLTVDSNVGLVRVDAYPRVSGHRDDGTADRTGSAVRNSTREPVDAFAFVDHQALYADLVRLKARNGWANLSLPRVVDVEVDGETRTLPLTQSLLRQGGWFELEAPPRLLEVSSLKHRALWQRLASELVCEYASKLYKHRLQRYQTEQVSVVWLHELSDEEREALFPAEYQVLVTPDETDEAAQLVQWVEALAEKVKRREFDDRSSCGQVESFGGESHLYNPLVHVPKASRRTLRILTRPTALNEGERQFVKDLEAWLATSPAMLEGREVFLLRNESRTGTGFFDVGGFYPDFMMWIVSEQEQRLVFVDPKGLGRITDLKGQAKVGLHETLKEIEARHPGLGVHLDAWLVSVTPRREAPVKYQGVEDALDHHIVYQAESDHIERLFHGVLGAGG